MQRREVRGGKERVDTMASTKGAACTVSTNIAGEKGYSTAFRDDGGAATSCGPFLVERAWEGKLLLTKEGSEHTQYLFSCSFSLHRLIYRRAHLLDISASDLHIWRRKRS